MIFFSGGFSLPCNDKNDQSAARQEYIEPAQYSLKIIILCYYITIIKPYPASKIASMTVYKLSFVRFSVSGLCD